MIPLRVVFHPGTSLHEQVVYAAKKAMVSGRLRPGDPFPSVRTLSKELKINPNTAHKIVTNLISAGLLETKPGVGTVVAARPNPTQRELTNLLEKEIEELTVEAKRLGVDLDDVVEALTDHWKRLTPKRKPDASADRGGR